VDIPRRYDTAVELINAQLKSCGLGKHVAASVGQGFEILTNERALELGPEFARFLTKFLRAPET